MSGVPIIRFEVENLRHTVTLALQGYVAKMDSDIQTAVAQACSPECVALVIQATARKEIDAAVRQEVENFFRYGNGRETIKRAVAEKLAIRAEEHCSDG